jgi:hypothetical protein
MKTKLFIPECPTPTTRDEMVEIVEHGGFMVLGTVMEVEEITMRHLVMVDDILNTNRTPPITCRLVKVTDRVSYIIISNQLVIDYRHADNTHSLTFIERKV